MGCHKKHRCCRSSCCTAGPTGPAGPVRPPEVHCALPDACVGGVDDTVYLTVGAAINDGISRVRVRGNVTETFTTLVLPSYTHIWIDGGVTWTIPVDATFDATNAQLVWISGNSSGLLVFSRTSPGSLFTAPFNTPTTYMFENINVDYSTTTSGNVQMCPKQALQRYRNMDITLPNIADLQFFDFDNDFFDPTDAETSTSAENIVLRGTGTAISNIIGHTPGLGTASGNYRNITLTGVLPVGDGTFAQPVISLFGAIGGGAVTFDTLHCDIPSQILDIIMSGNVTRILRRNLGGTPIFNLRTVGNAGHTFEDCTVNIFEVTTQAGQYSNITSSSITVSANNNCFSNIHNQFQVLSGMVVTGSANRFVNSSFVAPLDPAFISVTGDGNLFSNCHFVDVDHTTPAPAFFMSITGAGNSVNGCQKIDTGAAPAAERNLSVTGTLTTIVATNLVTQTAAGTGGNTVAFVGAPLVQVSHNTFDNATTGVPAGGSVVLDNLIA
jgi:hypothetical protein